MESGMPAQLNTRDHHHCFGCGALNPTGLHLQFFAAVDGTRVWADFTPDRRQEGAPGLVHGGLLAALLDETLGWALFGHGIWAVTTRLSLTYRRQVPIGTPIRVSAWLVRDRGRALLAEGRIEGQDGQTLVEAAGTFMRVPESRRQIWENQLAGAEQAGVEREPRDTE